MLLGLEFPPDLVFGLVESCRCYVAISDFRPFYVDG